MSNKVSIPKLHSIKWKIGPSAENITHIGPSALPKSLPAVNILQGAAEAMLDEVCLVGYTRDGREYVASTTYDQQRAAYMFARAHLIMLRYADE